MRYRRVAVPGASYFFTVVTYRRQPLFSDANAVSLLQAAIELVRGKRPFEVEAQVVLPDHIHAIWALPDDDCDYPTRWRLIKEAFTRVYGPNRDPQGLTPSPAASCGSAPLSSSGRAAAAPSRGSGLAQR